MTDVQAEVGRRLREADKLRVLAAIRDDFEVIQQAQERIRYACESARQYGATEEEIMAQFADTWATPLPVASHQGS